MKKVLGIALQAFCLLGIIYILGIMVLAIISLFVFEGML